GSKKFEVVMRAEQKGTVTSTASIDSSRHERDDNSSNDTATASTVLFVPQTDLSVTLADEPDPVFIGNNLTYTLEASNAGPDNAPNVTVSQELPAEGATFVSASDGCSQAGGVVTCSLDELAPGDSSEFEVVVSGDQVGTLTSSASIAINGFEEDPDLQNNVAMAVTSVELPKTDLSVTLSDPSEPVTVGDNFTYSLGASNGGPQDATEVEVTQQLPADVSFVSASDGCSEASGVVTCSIGDLASGDGEQFEVVVKAEAPGTISSNASISGGDLEEDPDSANNVAVAVTTLELPKADLSVAVADAPDPVTVGDNVTYAIGATNAGPRGATDVQVTQQLPAGVSFVSASSGCSEANGVVTCSAGDLAPGALAQFAVVLKADQPGTVSVTANVAGSSDQQDPNASNNAVTVTTEATCTITGTAGNNTLVGTAGRDVICGLGGNDSIRAQGGADLIFGGDGADVVQGAAGNDVIRGDAGNDDLRGQDGNDTLYGDAGFDKLNGGAGTDSCSVGPDGGRMASCERRLA
ncbi:MAG TPA: hypothetical protein VHI97_05670, partial [Actinomycetota bacterium]|nr:hypothetical protein [Actinomycetota bacterium]